MLISISAVQQYFSAKNCAEYREMFFVSVYSQLIQVKKAIMAGKLNENVQTLGKRYANLPGTTFSLHFRDSLTNTN